MKRAQAFRSRPGRPWYLYGDDHRIILFVVASLIAAVLLVESLAVVIGHASIATDDDVVPGVVVAARYGSRVDFVTVRLDQPANREVNLRLWSGRPRVGSYLEVRYKRSDPTRAMDARFGGAPGSYGFLWMSWRQVSLGLVGLVLAALAWGVWTGSRYASFFVEGTRAIIGVRSVRDRIGTVRQYVERAISVRRKARR